MDGAAGGRMDDFRNIQRDPEYTQLRHLDSPNIVFDDESWRKLRRWRDQFKRILDENPGADPNKVRNIRREISFLDKLETEMRERLERVSVDAVNRAVEEVNRIQGAMDVLTRIPEFVAMVNNARSIAPRPDDSTNVSAKLIAFFTRLDACTKGVLTPPMLRAARAMMHNIRVYTCILSGAECDLFGIAPRATLSDLVVLADPMPRARARELMAKLGAWIYADPGVFKQRDMFGERRVPVTTPDMLRALAVLSPKCFNLLRKQWAANESMSAGAWISDISANIEASEIVAVFLYLFPRQLFARHADIAQRQMYIADALENLIHSTPAVCNQRIDARGYGGRAIDMLHRIAFPYVFRWFTTRNKPMVQGDDYRRVMMEMWTPELDVSPDYFEWSQNPDIDFYIN